MPNELAFASRNKHERRFHPQLRVLQPSNSILEISVALKKKKENQWKENLIFYHICELVFASKNKHEMHFHPQLRAHSA